MELSEEEVSPRLCPNCGKDLASFPSDIKVCPYCGGNLAIKGQVAVFRVCPKCKKSLTQFPKEVRICPYCATVLAPSPRQIWIRRALGATSIALLAMAIVFGGELALFLFVNMILAFIAGIHIILSTKYSIIGGVALVLLALASMLIPCIMGPPLSPVMLLLIVLPGLLAGAAPLSYWSFMILPMVSVVELIAAILILMKRI